MAQLCRCLIQAARTAKSKAAAVRSLRAARSRVEGLKLVGWPALSRAFERDVEAIERVIAQRFGGAA